MKFYKEDEVLKMYKFDDYFIVIQFSVFLEIFGENLEESNSSYPFDSDSFELILDSKEERRLVDLCTRNNSQRVLSNSTMFSD